MTTYRPFFQRICVLQVIIKFDYLFLPTVSPLIINISGESVLDQADDLDLTCEVTGIPTPSITWYHNGQELTSTTDSRVSFPKFNKMRIQYVRGYNSGEYQCVAVNDAGVARQALTVYVRGR